MFRFVTIIACISCAFAAILPDVFNGRIVNGVDTTIGDHPYQVSLQIYNGVHLCGGSIISEDIIVTAAHCVIGKKASNFKVRLGSTEYNKGGELVAVKAFKYHERYTDVIYGYDVAVMKLASPVRESSKIRYIKLSENSPVSGTKAVLTGWGDKCYLKCSISKILQEVEVDIVDNKDCRSETYKYGGQIKETMLCSYAYQKDACQGDSGGPLVANNELVGIVSWGIGCAFEGYPGVYCDVSTVNEWIKKSAQEL